jgi:hypothetical protein
MRVKLRWVVAVPFFLAALGWVASYLAEHIAHRSLDDTAYWGTVLPWVLNAIWYAGIIGCVVAVLLVTPAILVFRAMGKWPVLLGPKTRDSPEQRRATAQRAPRI